LPGLNLAPEAAINHKRPPRQQGGSKEDKRPANRPAAGMPGVYQGKAKQNKQNAVDRSDEGNRLGKSEEIFQRHGNKKKQQKGKALYQPQHAKPANRIVECPHCPAFT